MNRLLLTGWSRNRQRLNNFVSYKTFSIYTNRTSARTNSENYILGTNLQQDAICCNKFVFAANEKFINFAYARIRNGQLDHPLEIIFSDAENLDACYTICMDTVKACNLFR